MIRELVVRKDPNSTGSVADIRAQNAVLFEIHENMDSVARMVNQIEWIRKQIGDLQELPAQADEVLAASRELDEKFIALEDQFIAVGFSGDYAGDGLRFPEQFYYRSAGLASGIAQADFAPTTQQHESHEFLNTQLASFKNEFGALIENDLAGFNKLMKEEELPVIIVR